MRPLLISLFSAVSIFLFSCQAKTGGSVSKIVGLAKESDGSNWIFRVDGVKVTRENLLEEYLLPYRFAGLPDDVMEKISTDIPRKQNYVEMTETQVLTLLDAESKGILEDRDFRVFLKKQIRESVFQYYLVSQLGKGITVSDDEVAEYYNLNKDRFPGGLTAQGELELRSFLKEQKLKAKLDEHLKILRQKYKVEMNPSADLFSVKRSP